MLVENTPADGLPSAEGDFGFFSAGWDRFQLWRQKLFAALSRLSVSEILASARSGIAAGAHWALRHPFVSLACLAAAAFLVARNVALRRRRRPREESPYERELRRCRHDLEKLLAGLGIERPPHRTLLSAAPDVASRAGRRADEIRRALEHYTLLRYEPGHDRSDVHSLRVLITTLVENAADSGTAPGTH